MAGLLRGKILGFRTMATTTNAAARKPTLLYVGNPIEHAKSQWEKLRTSFTILPYTRRLSKPELIAAFQPGGPYAAIDGIIRPTNSTTDLPAIDEQLVAALPSSCKIISSVNHGYDNVDTEALARRGIWYCNGAGAADDSTADIGLFLIIAAFRHTSFCERTVQKLRSGDYFSVDRQIGNLAQNPRNRVLGVIGLGGVGRAVAERALTLGMRIHYFGRRRKSAVVEKNLGGAVYHETLAGLLKEADCVLVACPYSPETHHILHRETFGMMKRGVRVVNIARGKCIDEEALVDAIDEGIVASVGLDVYHDEYGGPILLSNCPDVHTDRISLLACRPKINPRLLDNWMVTLLPHIGGATIDTQAVSVPNIRLLALLVLPQ
jgi:lactate dehydrogenase-like 2-hydroxyacid dehydrogenase